MSLWNQMLELQCPYEKVRWGHVTFQNNSSDTRHQRLLVTNINPANLWWPSSITNKTIHLRLYLICLFFVRLLYVSQIYFLFIFVFCTDISMII